MAHEAVGAVLRAGDLAVDATAGNGHDTVFLANVVGPTGRVLAFDIQPAALRATQERLDASGCETQVDLIEDCHSTLGDILPRDVELRAAMFNLGYLPGSDKQAITSIVTTAPALAACFERLGQGGIISVMGYRGHRGGEDETESIAGVLDALDATRFTVERHEAQGTGPVLWLVRQSAIAELGEDSPDADGRMPLRHR